jgi:hypothetical protein
MLTFINSIILGAAAAALIPLLIHLFNRQRPKRIPFSALRFLQKLEKQRLRKVRLYQYLLILVRTLLVLLLVFAFSRPTITGGTFSGDNAARSTAVIVVDDAVNMRAYDANGNHYARARTRAESIISGFSRSDKVFLLTSHDARIIQAEESLPVTASYRTADWQNVLRQSFSLIGQNPNFNRELYIVSDFEFHSPGFSTLLDSLPDMRLYLVKIGDNSSDNYSIDSVAVTNRIFEVNRPVKFSVAISGKSGMDASSRDVQIFINDQRVDRAQFELNPDGFQTVDLQFVPRTAGIQRGYCEIEDDDLLADNRFYFAFYIPEKVRMLFVDNNPSPYLKTAMDVLGSQGNIEIVQESYSSVGRHNFSQFQVLLLSNPPGLSPSLRQRITDFATTSGGLILLPGPSSSPTEFNHNFAAISPGLKMTELNSAVDDAYYSLKPFDLSQEIFSGLLQDSETDIFRPQFYRYFRFLPDRAAKDLLKFENGDSFLREITSDDQHIFLLSSYPLDSWSDIQYRGFFIPLLIRLTHLAGSQSASTQPGIRAGEMAGFNLDIAAGGSDYSLNSIDGSSVKMIPEIRRNRLQFKTIGLEQPGLYPFRVDNSERLIISVNSMTNSLPFVTEELAGRSGYRVIKETGFSLSSILDARFGAELWKYFVALVLLMLGLELYLVKLSEGKESTKRI